MVKLTITTLAILGLIGSVQMQDASQQVPQAPQMPQLPQQQGNGFGFGGQMGQRQQGFNPLGSLLGGQNGGGPLGNLLGGQNGQNPLSSLLGGNGGQMNQQGLNGLTDTLRQLPQRGLEMLNNILQNVRSMVPLNLGRNEQMPRNPMGNMFQNMNGQRMPLNMQNPFANGNQNGGFPLGQLTQNLPGDLQGLTRPVTEALSQGRLPDVNSLTRSLSQTTNNLGQGLTRTLSGLVPGSGNGAGAATASGATGALNSQATN